MDILKDWYMGKLYPCEDICPKGPEYRALCDQIAAIQAYFQEHTDAQSNQKAEEFYSLLMDCCSHETYAGFSYGFRLGALLMHQVLTQPLDQA